MTNKGGRAKVKMNERHEIYVSEEEMSKQVAVFENGKEEYFKEEKSGLRMSCLWKDSK